MAPEVQTEVKGKQAPPVEIEKEEEHFHVIKLGSKRYEHDTELVTVAINGERRVMRRDELIPVPEGVCGVLDEAEYPQFRMPNEEEMLRGVKEKIVGKIRRYPYEKVFRDIPKDVYMALRKRAMDPTAKPVTEKEIQEMLARRK